MLIEFYSNWRGYIEKFLLAVLFPFLLLILNACGGTKPSIPFHHKVESITIINQKTGVQVNEIKDSSQIKQFLALMNASKISSFGEPASPGEVFVIVLNNGQSHLWFYFKKGTSHFDNKIYNENSKKVWAPDVSILKFFP